MPAPLYCVVQAKTIAVPEWTQILTDNVFVTRVVKLTKIAAWTTKEYAKNVRKLLDYTGIRSISICNMFVCN